MQTKSDIS